MLSYIHGTDGYRLRRAVTEYVTAIRAQQGSVVAVSTVDCADDGAGVAIERQLKYPSFFGDPTIIIAWNAAGPVMKDLLERYPLTTMDDIHLVAVQDTTRKETDRHIMAALAIAANTTEIRPLSHKQLSAWANDECRALGAVIEPEALSELLRRTDGESGRVAHGLAALASYANGSVIGIEAVQRLIPTRTERDEWGLSNAIAALDKRAMLAALWESAHEGIPEQLLIGSLAAGLRNLLIIKHLSARTANPASIAKAAGIHPFVVSKSLRGAASADAQRLRNAHIALARLDRDTKDGRADAVDGMFAILLSL